MFPNTNLTVFSKKSYKVDEWETKNFEKKNEFLSEIRHYGALLKLWSISFWPHLRRVCSWNIFVLKGVKIHGQAFIQILSLNWPIIPITPITPLSLLMIAKLNFTLKIYFLKNWDGSNIEMNTNFTKFIQSESSPCPL